MNMPLFFFISYASAHQSVAPALQVHDSVRNRIIAALKEGKAGAMTKELCRRHGISAIFFHWKVKYAGMTVFRSDVRGS